MIRSAHKPQGSLLWTKILHRAINHERPHYATIYSHRNFLPLRIRYSCRHALLIKIYILILCPSCTLKDEVPHICNIAGRNLVLYMVHYTFKFELCSQSSCKKQCKFAMKERDSRWEDSREITHLGLLQELVHTF
jgi:hypothetical protein